MCPDVDSIPHGFVLAIVLCGCCALSFSLCRSDFHSASRQFPYSPQGSRRRGRQGKTREKAGKTSKKDTPSPKRQSGQPAASGEASTRSAAAALAKHFSRAGNGRSGRLTCSRSWSGFAQLDFLSYLPFSATRRRTFSRYRAQRG